MTPNFDPDVAASWLPRLVHRRASVTLTTKQNTMEAYQQRVVDEKAELDEKLTKLDAFMMSERVKTLPADEHDRMTRQANHMRQYSSVLGERIAAFPTAA